MPLLFPLDFNTHSSIFKERLQLQLSNLVQTLGTPGMWRVFLAFLSRAIQDSSLHSRNAELLLPISLQHETDGIRQIP